MAPRTFTNPVYPGYFADPFVLRVGDVYYAYGTGSVIGGRVFEILRSTDLVRWTSLGGALEPLHDSGAQDYWAPEVAAVGGRYFMYYSVGVGDTNHTLRVAMAFSPEGPFVDAGTVLTPDERFAIDPHPFQDVDGQWYLFYARDLLDGERVGTSLAVDRLLEMTRAEGAPRTVARATADWQLFAARRAMYGQVYDWYTLEGPFVVRHDDRYYCLYSGGAWEHGDYGVSYVVADHPLGPYLHPEEEGPVVLRSVEGQVLGPGHSCVVTGPDGRHRMVYHAWDPARTARRMCVDALVWGPDGPRCDGPSFSPRPVPERR
ncbi:MAG TPA: glycoside hydrolase family 43 protein [Egibacteraceae bacterium]|nr:glycoside hydrolase family 43 protein [Egibacteraceae bacterium]